MALERYKELYRRAKEYHDSSQWEEKLRVLQEARQICESEDLPDRPTRTRTVLIEISGILRRLGMYEAGIKALEESLQADDQLDVVVRAKLVGEMGIMYRHSNAYEKARDLFLQQFQLASQGKGIDADAQMCQAIGNAGMANYNLSTQQRPHDSKLLDMVINQLHERVSRARLLYSRVIKEDRDSSYYDVSQQWETVGMNRLILCYILKGDPGQAVVQAEETLRHQRTRDPTVKAFTLFFCGYAFWSHGRHGEAVNLWSPPQGTTTPAIALCKEASVEHVSYLRLLAQSGVRLDSYDEQGFNALDFAVLSESSDAKLMIDIILDTYRKTLHQDSMAPDKVDVTVRMRHHQSLLRKEYRRILQEHVRPIFMNENSAIRKVRNAYATLFEAEMARATLLDTFHYVKYSDFKALKRIPGNEDKLAQQYRNAGGVHGTHVHDSVFVIFLSYRQLGMTRNPPRPGPDDDHHTQYKRMRSAVEDFLKMHPEISPDDLCLWLVSTLHAIERYSSLTTYK